MKIIVACIAVLMLCISIVQADELRNFLESETRYWGIHETIDSTELDQLVVLKRKAESAGVNRDQRIQAYTELFQYVQKLRGFPEGKVPAASAINFWSDGQPPVPPTLAIANPGTFGNFKKRGSGPIAIILIPDLGTDWSVFDSFMQRNLSRFTFYAVTLPGFGGTNPPRRPEKLDFGTMDWWDNATKAVLNLIANQKLTRPVILGHQAGSYLAMKLALDNPKIIRGVVVLNGLLYAPIPGIPEKATRAERIRIVNSWTPAELFPNASQAQYRAVMLQNAEWFCKNKEGQKKIAELLSTSRPSVWWNYFAELATTDLTTDIKGLKVPMLVLPSVYDAGSAGFESSKIALGQWNPLDRSVSSLPITVIRMEDCRAYATEDQPQKLDEVILGWTGRL